MDSQFFNIHERNFILAIIEHISDHEDIDVSSTMKLFGLKYTSSLENKEKLAKTTSIQCRTILSNEKQCSRTSKKDGFCMIHHKQFEAKKLDKSRIMEASKFSKFEQVVNKLREIREIPKLVQLKLTYFNDEEYLYDPHTDYVYDFDTYEKVGKIDKFKQLKLIETL